MSEETVAERVVAGETATNEAGNSDKLVPARDTLHHIVVVGGGAAGLELVTGLGDKLAKRKLADITLIERARTHIWKPLLHEVAAGSMNVDNHALDYLAQAHWHHFRYRYGEMIGLDRSKREVCLAPTYDDEGNEITPARSFHYDTLVMAVGSSSNDFGTPGVKEFAIPLDTLKQAERFNKRLVNACIRANAQAEPVRPGQLHVAIIGAGATGTELAAQLHRTTRQVAAFGLEKIDPERDFRITLIEGADRILPALPERISKATEELLTDLGVIVKAKAKVTEVRKDGVALADGGFIPAELVVWAAGVKGPDFLRNLDGLEITRNNQLVVTPTLQTTLDPDIFAMGDCASCPREGTNTTVPPRAQAAHQEASHLLKQLQNRLKGKPLKPFVYRDFGSLVSLGKYSTVGNLMGKLVGGNMMIEGYFARMMYVSLYKMHLMALHGSSKVALEMLSRTIAHRTEPAVKLH
jgi:NADH:ubiquinone reductase (H+-translocating)